jgi:diaminopimelate decarboxylase
VLQKYPPSLDFKKAEEISREFGDSFYIYDSNVLKSNFLKFRSSFNSLYPKVEIAYSYKTNYMPSLLKQIYEMGGISEVVSEMEYELAVLLGINPRRIIYNGPVKSKQSLLSAIKCGATVNIDSFSELELLQAFVSDFSHEISNVEIGIRCNFDRNPNLNSRFGIPVNSKDFLSSLKLIDESPKIFLAGLHCHLPNRDLESFSLKIKNLVSTSKEIFSNAPKFLDIGGGFYGPDLPIEILEKNPPNFNEYAEIITEELIKAYPHFENQPTLILEPGTALSSNTFTYWTKVVTTKVINGKNIAIVDGSIHEMNPNSRLARKPTEILYGKPRSQLNLSKWTISGYTCIESDLLSTEFEGDFEVGDFIGYSHTGAYNTVMKPPFIRPASAIVEIGRDNEATTVHRMRQTLTDLLSGYSFQGIHN